MQLTARPPYACLPDCWRGQRGEPIHGSWSDADNPTAIDMDHDIAVADRARAMSDDKARTPDNQTPERFDDRHLGPNVNGAGRLIKYQDGRILQESPRK